jgi:hypothetical protein
VAQVGGPVADPAHDRDLALVEARLQLGHRRVQTEPAPDGQRVRDAQRRANRRVARVAVRDDHVQPVVAAGQVDREEDALVVADGRRRERLQLRQVRADRDDAGADRAVLHEAPAGEAVPFEEAGSGCRHVVLPKRG